jgi:hypothetical protein
MPFADPTFVANTFNQVLLLTIMLNLLILLIDFNDTIAELINSTIRHNLMIKLLMISRILL